MHIMTPEEFNRIMTPMRARLKVAARGIAGDDDRAEDMELHDDVALISAIVDRLPSLQRTVFRMKEIEGYDAADIMLVTGCTAEALCQNLSRARRKIRDEFMRITSRP